MKPQTGRVVADFLDMLRTGDLYELVKADRTDGDPLALRPYENFAVPNAKDCGGIAVHTAMHGAAIGRLCGIWLNSEAHIESLVSGIGNISEIVASDTGQ